MSERPQLTTPLALPIDPKGTSTILVADDDPIFRRVLTS